MWNRKFDLDSRYTFRITSDSFIVELTGGSIIIKSRKNGDILKQHKGHNYLYTGDISPDETQCFGLENGKHFYVYSLQNYELIKRITLPRHYEAIDLCGHYSDDGKTIVIPAHRWVSAARTKDGYFNEGHYEHALFRYETEQYTFVDKTVVPDRKKYSTDIASLWEPLITKDQEPADPFLKQMKHVIDYEN